MFLHTFALHIHLHTHAHCLWLIQSYNYSLSYSCVCFWFLTWSCYGLTHLLLTQFVLSWTVTLETHAMVWPNYSLSSLYDWPTGGTLTHELFNYFVYSQHSSLIERFFHCSHIETSDWPWVALSRCLWRQAELSTCHEWPPSNFAFSNNLRFLIGVSSSDT